MKNIQIIKEKNKLISTKKIAISIFTILFALLLMLSFYLIAKQIGTKLSFLLGTLIFPYLLGSTFMICALKVQNETRSFFCMMIGTSLITVTLSMLPITMGLSMGMEIDEGACYLAGICTILSIPFLFPQNWREIGHLLR